MTFIRIFLAILAVYRLAELLKYDEGPYGIIASLRGYIGTKAASGSGLFVEITKAIHCLHCSGLWVAIPFALLIFVPTLLGDVFLVWLGIAGGQSFLTNYLGRLEEDD